MLSKEIIKQLGKPNVNINGTYGVENNYFLFGMFKF